MGNVTCKLFGLTLFGGVGQIQGQTELFTGTLKGDQTV